MQPCRPVYFASNLIPIIVSTINHIVQPAIDPMHNDVLLLCVTTTTSIVIETPTNTRKACW